MLSSSKREEIIFYFVDMNSLGWQKVYEYSKGAGGCRNDIIPDNEIHTLFRLIENAGGVPYRIIMENDVAGSENCLIIVGNGIRDLLGISPEDFKEGIYRSIVEKMVSLDNNIPVEIIEARKELFSGKIENFRVELQVKMPGGGKKRIFEFATPVVDSETGKVKEICGIFFDPEKWNSFNVELTKKYDNHEFENFKKTFLRNISHEIRTPLNAIIGFSSILCEPECPQEKREEYAEIILKSADTLLETVNDIIEASQIESGTVKIKKEPANLNSIIRSVYDRLKKKAGDKGINISFKVPLDDEDVNIMTDQEKVKRVLQNMGDNAVKFTDGGEVEIGYVISGGMVEFYVYDTGKGISEEYYNYIFTSFFQADNGPSRLHGGTGLGLYISKGYVELLGGKIWFFSEPGEGTTFFFSIPFERV